MLPDEQRLLARLTEATSDSLWMFTADWQELVFVNSAYEDIFGHPVSFGTVLAHLSSEAETLPFAALTNRSAIRSHTRTLRVLGTLTRREASRSPIRNRRFLRTGRKPTRYCATAGTGRADFPAGAKLLDSMVSYLVMQSPAAKPDAVDGPQ